MRTLRWWTPLASVILALAFGFVPYIALTYSGKIPAALRDNPWPMELVAVAATFAAIGLAIQAFRQKRLRMVATASALLATLATVFFLFVLHVVSYEIPGVPKELAIGSSAPDFTLVDAKGQTFSLASTRGQPVLLVFHRGVW